MDYTRLYEQDGAAAAGTTAVGNSGLGATASELASVPSAKSRKKKNKKASVTPSQPTSLMNPTVEP